MDMLEIARFSGITDWIELASVEREQTSRQFINWSIQFCLEELPLLNTIKYLGG